MTGGFGRVDMNPQWVMMVCRDYLWTGDTDYLNAMWPGVVKAMEYTASLDSDGDGLPDKDMRLPDLRPVGFARRALLHCLALDRRAPRRRPPGPRPGQNGGRRNSWTILLDKSSASFDRVFFNGEYYSLWVDGALRDEICMSDQISGEWFSHLMGLPTTISEKNLAKATDSIWKNNFSPETGLHNATAPKGGADGPTMNNLQAGGVWSGIEFAFASFLMDHGRYADGVRLVEAVHRRYLRAGMPWNARRMRRALHPRDEQLVHAAGRDRFQAGLTRPNPGHSADRPRRFPRPVGHGLRFRRHRPQIRNN